MTPFSSNRLQEFISDEQNFKGAYPLIFFLCHPSKFLAHPYGRLGETLERI